MDATALGRNAVRSIPVRFGTVRWSRVRFVLLGSLIGLAIALDLVGLYGFSQRLDYHGDWYLMAAVDPAQPYAQLPGWPHYFRWAPLAAWVWSLAIVPLGYGLWALLHLVAIALFRDWRAIALLLATYPFWDDLGSGSPIIFVLLAAWWALRGSRPAVIAYVVLCVLMPRPIMLPVLAWLLWQRWDARLTLLLAGSVVLRQAIVSGQLTEWVGRLLVTAREQTAGAENLAPSAWIGAWWTLIGLPLAAWLIVKRRFGLASLAASPYWLPYYLMFGVLELDRQIQRIEDDVAEVDGCRERDEPEIVAGRIRLR